MARPLLWALAGSLLGISGCAADSDAARDALSGVDLGNQAVTDGAGGQAPDGAQGCASRVLDQYGEVTNARDIGGFVLSSGRRVACAQLYRGGDLSQLTEGQGCAEFEELGITTILDTRTAAEASAAQNALCATQRATTVLLSLPRLLPDSADNYIALLDQTEGMRKAFRAFGDAGSYPVYVHCVMGRDRPSVIVALVLSLLGASRETIQQEFALSNAAGVPVKPATLDALLDEVEARGGAETYLETEVGITTAELDGLRARLRVSVDPG